MITLIALIGFGCIIYQLDRMTEIIRDLKSKIENYE